MNKHYFVFARILFFAIGVSLLAAIFVPYNEGNNGSYSLFELLADRHNDAFWLKYLSKDGALIYVLSASVACVASVSGIVISFIKNPKVFRVLSVGVFALAAMYFAFAFGSLVNVLGLKRATISYNTFGLILSALALSVGLRVTIDKNKINVKNSVAEKGA